VLLGLEHPLLYREKRIPVEPLAQTLDGRAHRPGMGREVKEAELDVLRREVELLPH
jgi:hypothetical protein